MFEEITTVEETFDGGYLVNGKVYVPSDPRNYAYRRVQGWIAQGNTPAPSPFPAEEAKAAIYVRLDQIDRESIRALRAKAVGQGKPQDDSTLGALEAEAAQLRAQLQTL